MACGACFHSNEARRLLLEKLQKLGATDRAIKQSGSVSCDAVDLKNVLGQIEADCGSLHLDGSSYAQLWKLHYGALRRREQEPSTPSGFARLGDEFDRRFYNDLVSSAGFGFIERFISL
jgi:hypothetical protein